MNKKQIISILLIIILVVNIIVFAMKKINPLLFWLIIGLCALVSYWWMPRINV